jgi:flavin-dependent dehydrogenase
LNGRLAGAEPLWDKPLAVVCPTGGHLHRERRTAVYRVGDRLAHIPPFTGDGLAIALTSAALAVEHIRLGRSPDAYLAAARQLTASSIRLASIVSGLAGSSGGRNLMLGAAAWAPGLIGTIVRRTRLALAADGV